MNFQRYEYAFNKHGTPKSQFDYALCLLRSPYKSDMQKAALLLTDLLNSDKSNKRDYLFHLAVVHTRLNNYIDAEGYVDKIYKTEPNNSQVSTLRSVIAEKKKSQAISDIATLSVCSAIAGIAIFVMRGFFKT